MSLCAAVGNVREDEAGGDVAQLKEQRERSEGRKAGSCDNRVVSPPAALASASHLHFNKALITTCGDS